MAEKKSMLHLFAHESEKVIAFQTGTPLIYSQNGQIVREYITEAPKQQSTTKG